MTSFNRNIRESHIFNRMSFNLHVRLTAFEWANWGPLLMMLIMDCSLIDSLLGCNCIISKRKLDIKQWSSSVCYFLCINFKWSSIFSFSASSNHWISIEIKGLKTIELKFSFLLKISTAIKHRSSHLNNYVIDFEWLSMAKMACKCL